MINTVASPFTEAELKFVQDAFHELEFEGVVAHFETIEVPNDAIVCANGFTLQKEEVATVSLTGTAVYKPVFTISETVWTPATLFQPEEADYRDFAKVSTLAEAVKAVLLRDYEYKINNVLDSMAIAASYGNPEEL